MKQENPAKTFLRQYTALKVRVAALEKAINSAMENAMSTSISLKEIKVLSSPATHDPMAEDVTRAVDELETLYECKDKANAALRDILNAIDSLNDERQKALLTMRYINGASYPEIMRALNYEEAQTYVIHGRALIGINKWLERRAKNV